MITVLRLGHRRGRDDRISTHVGLVARQFGAGKIIYAGEKDENMMESLEDVVKRWGGNFSVEYNKSFRKIIREFEGTTIHLTMYGIPFQEKMENLEEIKDEEDFLIVVGSQKVPKEVYEMVDYNLAVGSQPHSEVAALGVSLYELDGGKIPQDFENAEIEVVPQERGKKTLEK